jgi:hypothetical protein
MQFLFPIAKFDFGAPDVRTGDLMLTLCCGLPLRSHISTSATAVPRVLYFPKTTSTDLVLPRVVPLQPPPAVAASVFCTLVPGCSSHLGAYGMHAPSAAKIGVISNLTLNQRTQITSTLRGLFVCTGASILSPCGTFCLNVTR